MLKTHLPILAGAQKTGKFLLSLGGVLSAALLANGLTAEKASAILTIKFLESGGNVTGELTGSLNTTGLTSFAGGNGSDPFIIPANGFVSFAKMGASLLLFDSALNSKPALIYGTGSFTFANTFSGDDVFIDGKFNGVGLPNGYVSGAALNSTMTFNSASFTSLGMTPGTYEVGFNSGLNADTITIQVGTPTPVPLESDALPIVGATLFMAGGLWWKRKRAEAKVSEFMAKK